MVLFQTLPKNRLHVGALVFAWALVFAQSIALVHGITHAPALYGGHWTQGVEPEHHATASPLERLFGNHQDHSHDHDGSGKARCQLLDQNSHLDGLCSVHAVALPTHFATLPPVAFAGLFTVRWLAAFHARGPPDLR
jgi:hypothetical protein